ncbi:hypothetical protein MFU01_76220 [Myxococcus fulvus]|uniref:Uncharacterized protein n=1 Tax=Myxococcus fulvus TaxID=33 RepID=A0A511TEJ1_MYXFU|nr:hypothetical protein MFU01_76220 [Myxococcus fulvus]
MGSRALSPFQSTGWASPTPIPNVHEPTRPTRQSSFINAPRDTPPGFTQPQTYKGREPI